MLQNTHLGETKIAFDHDKHTILFARSFAAPRARVFEAWTRPEHVVAWWDPSGTRLAECEIDLRPGGAFKFVHEGAQQVPPFSGIYREIVAPDLLVFEAMGTIGRVDLTDVAGRTFMTVTIECGSAAHLNQFVQLGIDTGTSQTLDNLVAYVGAMT